ncbi:ABC transporter permease [Terriglobus saanensis]|uniref:Permease n=1 Tax=Terriglobus saanensis (strain ATCC BAA-1853 / DSM 23119 / SP1PR4) TaxID=401053 RepID=E8V6A7_TERSS|nr:ABC transporter permease [Terriglobus saanensis]ADV81572.1 permease [Terriglobus saanensis SP1PR4]
MFWRRRSPDDFAEEIKSHLELEADELRREGISEREAHWKAMREFGNVRAAQERFYMKGRWIWLDKLMRDLRFGMRSLWKTPGFTVTAVLTLALGVGANTAVFSVMNAVLLKSLPVEDPQRVVYVKTSGAPRRANNTGNWDTSLSYPVYDALRREKNVLSDVMAYVPLANDKIGVRIGAQPEEAEADMVSGNFFSGLGVKMVRGRGFIGSDETDHAPIAVLSSKYWTARFASDPDVVGKTIYVKGVPLTIAGVAAAGFEGVEPGHSTDLWIPLQNSEALNAWGAPFRKGKNFMQVPDWWCLRMVARLAPGVSREQAAQRLQGTFKAAAYISLGSPLAGEKPPVLSFDEAKNFPGYEEEWGKPLRMLMAMVGLVLLIAMTNIVMLLMARNATRQKEFSLRLALGAQRGELLRQLLVESLLLVTLGGALAWAFAQGATRMLGIWAHIDSSLSPDRMVLLATLVVLLLAAVLFGLAPFRTAVAGGAEMALKTSAATSGTDAGKTRTGKIVVALQMALCVVLLVGGGLLVRTLQNLQNIPLGIRTEGLLVFGVSQPNATTGMQSVQFYEELLRKLRALPGVEAVTVMGNRVGSGWSNNNNAMVDGKEPQPVGGGSTMQRNNYVGADFFHTLGIPIVMGREFADVDTPTSQQVAVVSELFAQRFLPNVNPLGHHINGNSKKDDVVIVGIAKNNKYTSMNEEPIPMIWYHYAQAGEPMAMHVEMHVNGDPMSMLPSARKVVASLDPNIPLVLPMTQRAQFEQSISQQLMFARLAEFFGVLAVVLVATGLYGTLAYRVSMRTAEIGVRMAVGARRGQVVWMILRDSLILTGVGVLVGVPLAMLVARALTTSLYGVKPMDVMSYVMAVVGVTLVALAASALPAGRAASVDPLTALRAE